MNNKQTNRLAALCLLLGVFTASSAFAELAVIVHPSSSVSKITKTELSDLYLGYADTFANGSDAEPLDQASATPARRSFIKSVLGMEEGALKRHWSKLMFSGKGQPPQTLDSDEAVRNAVAANPKGLGYIDKNAVNNTIKVILIIP